MNIEKNRIEKVEFYEPVSLNNRDFKRLSEFIMSQYGIKMPPDKKTMLQSRLQKRLKKLNYTSFRDYIDFVFSPQGQNEELTKMVDAISTNKTDFFREKIHFDYLYSQGIDDYLEKTGKSKISIWSAGCSSGEEPYTIAIALNEYNHHKRVIDFQILATDISSGVLENAMIGIYHEDKVAMFSEYLRKKYLLRGKDTYKHKVRIVTELRNKINFQRFNLVSQGYSGLGMFDIIFCRNVMIYFEREVQYRLLKQFTQCLNPEGYLFLGHSESITGYTLPLKQIKPTIFRKI
ncbi:MAG: hypothetical protein JXB24_14710 [Bacteroidales bacterium]|nr:hypothetical protein [Bacteroidales bacterium]